MICKPSTPEAFQLIMDGSRAFADIEQNGMRIDVPYVDRMIVDTGSKIRDMENELRQDDLYHTWRKVYGEKSDMGSRSQLAHVVFNVMGIKSTKETEKGNIATDVEAFEEVDLPFVRRWFDMQKLMKVRNTYLLGIQRETTNGFLHPAFNLHLVITYRSCVAKGSLIEVVRDVSKQPKGIPIEDVRAGDFVYCYDNALNLVVKKVLWAGKTGTKKVVRVHWHAVRGKRGHLDVTPEHRVRLVDGQYVEARHLVGDYRSKDSSKRAPKIGVLAMGRVGDTVWQTGMIDGILDHRLVYSNLIGELGPDDVVHHKDKNHLNNCVGNLERKTKSHHSRDHALAGDCFTDDGRRRGCLSRLRNHQLFGDRWGKKSDNPRWLDIGHVQFLKMLSKVGGRVTQIDHDFSVMKSKAEFLGIDLKVVKDRYDSDGVYISRGRLLRLFDGSLQSVSKGLRVNREKAQRLLRQRGLEGAKIKECSNNPYGRAGKPNNHKITRIEYLDEEVDVYDIEVEDCYNFIANEICVHNSSSDPNFQNWPNRDPRQRKIVRRSVIPRSPDHVLLSVDFSALEFRGAACVVGDTLIETAEGLKRIDSVCESVARGNKVYVYGYDHDKSGVDARQVTDGGVTRNNAVVWRANLDDGCYVVATPDHEFMMADGSYKPLCKLNAGDDLMSARPWRRLRQPRVASVEFVGTADVYNINVEGIHNYATSAGVVVKNCFWRDPQMIAYASDSNLDIHRDMAAECYLLDLDQVSKDARSYAKNRYVFPILYGSYYKSTGRDLWSFIHRGNIKRKDGVGLYDHLAEKGITTESRFIDHIKTVDDGFNEKFPQWSDSKEKWWDDYLKLGGFPLMTGFMCYGVFSRNFAMNAPVQGPSFHLMLWSCIEMNKWLKENKMRSCIIGQIHDSLELDVHCDEFDDVLAQVNYIMTQATRKRFDWVVTPLGVEAARGEENWYDMKPVEVAA